MKGTERGSEVVQFAIAVPLLLFVVFGIMQVGGMMLAASQLSCGITRACRQLDIAGLQHAEDKEAFVKAGVLGAATQLVPSNLDVWQVRAFDQQERISQSATGGDIAEQLSTSTTLSYDIRYEIPSLLSLPGLFDQSFSRHVVCTYVEERVVEVRLGSS